MLQVTDLDVFYGDAQALWGVSVTVGEAEVVSIVGSNGAGKSTFVNAVMGINRARRGSIILDGIELTTLARHRVNRHGVAIVPEGRRLFAGLSVQDNPISALSTRRLGQTTQSPSPGSIAFSRAWPNGKISWPEISAVENSRWSLSAALSCLDRAFC
jgi:ABC-type branched-subunit amino acid transport system ATPase component